MPVPEPEAGQRWGILGGTFDPVHYGHLTLAKQVCRLEALAGVFLVPAHVHPFKDAPLLAEYYHRLAMLRIAISDDDDLLICEIEKEDALPGYTLETIRALKKRFRGVEFYFIIGLDNLDRVSQWRNPNLIVEEVRLLVGNRPKYNWTVPQWIPPSRVRFVNCEEIPVSSTEIRDAIKRQEDDTFLQTLTPGGVVRYIRENGLYR